MTAVLRCAYCGADNDAPGRYCRQCGRVLGPAPLMPGLVLHQRYRVAELFQPEAGPAGFSCTIWKVEDTATGRPMLLREYDIDPRLKIADALAKVTAFTRLRHAHIAAILDLFDHAGRVMLIMESAGGRTLEDVLDEHPQGIPEARVLVWGDQLCSGLEYLHTQDPPVIYRDLRPAAVLVDPADRVQLVDFGYARLFRPEKTGDTQQMGTPGYVAPEMYERAQTDARSDIFSLGVSLHRLLTCHQPGTTFPRLPRVRELNPAVSPELEAVITRATRLEPRQRYPSAEAMGAALRACPAYRPPGAAEPA